MKLSRTAAYGVHSMVYIARHNDGPPVIGHLAAKETRIPEGFLLRILVGLSRAGLLRSMKGPNGGYNLARSAKAITLLDIIEAVEGVLHPVVDPVSHPPGALDKKLQDVATSTTEAARKVLERVTLAELAGAASAKKSR